MIFETLNYMAERFNRENIVWGVGASIVLYEHELVEKPNDIDILVDKKDIEKVDNILSSIGKKKAKKDSGTYSTKYFYEYIVNNADIDVMSELIINHKAGKYRFTFDEKSIVLMKNTNNINIPFTSLEDWYILYQLIPNRERKVNLIEEYLHSYGVRNIDLINRALTKELPEDVRERIRKLIK